MFFFGINFSFPQLRFLPRAWQLEKGRYLRMDNPVDQFTPGGLRRSNNAPPPPVGGLRKSCNSSPLRTSTGSPLRISTGSTESSPPMSLSESLQNTPSLRRSMYQHSPFRVYFPCSSHNGSSALYHKFGCPVFSYLENP